MRGRARRPHAPRPESAARGRCRPGGGAARSPRASLDRARPARSSGATPRSLSIVRLPSGVAIETTVPVPVSTSGPRTSTPATRAPRARSGRGRSSARLPMKRARPPRPRPRRRRSPPGPRLRPWFAHKCPYLPRSALRVGRSRRAKSPSVQIICGIFRDVDTERGRRLRSFLLGGLVGSVAGLAAAGRMRVRASRKARARPRASRPSSRRPATRKSSSARTSRRAARLELRGARRERGVWPSGG